MSATPVPVEIADVQGPDGALGVRDVEVSTSTEAAVGVLVLDVESGRIRKIDQVRPTVTVDVGDRERGDRLVLGQLDVLGDGHRWGSR